MFVLWVLLVDKIVLVFSWVYVQQKQKAHNILPIKWETCSPCWWSFSSELDFSTVTVTNDCQVPHPINQIFEVRCTLTANSIGFNKAVYCTPTFTDEGEKPFIISHHLLVNLMLRNSSCWWCIFLFSVDWVFWSSVDFTLSDVWQKQNKDQFEIDIANLTSLVFPHLAASDS